MTDITISLPDKAIEELRRMAHRTNADEGTNFTLEEWIALHLSEIAISTELSKAAETMRTEHEEIARQNLEGALRAKRDLLLTDLDSSSPR